MTPVLEIKKRYWFYKNTRIEKLKGKRLPLLCNHHLLALLTFYRCRVKGQRLPFGPYSVVRSDVDGVGGGVVPHSQTQVSDAARPVFLHQDVLGLQVSVGNSWLPCTPRATISTRPQLTKTYTHAYMNLQ